MTGGSLLGFALVTLVACIIAATMLIWMVSS